ncbi:MAG: hypothetical protein BSOLF_0671 [Candidatus Carbobacillus altaicus]|uniref:Uncharacterized protein n=1 Tax=Candidatus Carbonibacillus altaicus TaxID=2163959 RepID=A0A2R6Y548_9BACL|nr:MAG: hypothetical protein BSOLF_0671 [Candidatus Carbobacillus altaicus]
MPQALCRMTPSTFSGVMPPMVTIGSAMSAFRRRVTSYG